MTNSLLDLWRLFVSPASFSILMMRFTSENSGYFNKILHTFKLEVVYVVLSDNKSSLLHPVILIELLHLATHHDYFLLWKRWWLQIEKSKMEFPASSIFALLLSLTACKILPVLRVLVSKELINHLCRRDARCWATTALSYGSRGSRSPRSWCEG